MSLGYRAVMRHVINQRSIEVASQITSMLSEAYAKLTNGLLKGVRRWPYYVIPQRLIALQDGYTLL